MQISSVQGSNLNFTSVIPFKVFIDGKRCYEPEELKLGCKKLRDIIVKCPDKDRKKAQLINSFWYNDKDFNINNVKNGTYAEEPGRYIRFNYNKKSGGAYILTGDQAEALYCCGENLGRKKASNMKDHGTLDTYQVFDASKTYHHKADSIIGTRKNRLKDEYGNPLELIINLVSNGKNGKSTYKIKLEDIEFDYIV